MSGFAGQFVPVKIVTDGNPEWGKWARKYPIDGSGIPRLYVIRSDGEMMYGAVGSLPGDKLPQMLLAALQRSGRAFSAAEAQMLQTAVADAQTALDNGDLLRASIALMPVTKFGSPDEIGSYASAAVEAGEVYQRLQAQIESSAEKAKARLDEGDFDRVLDSMLTLCEAEAAFKLFPKLKRQAADFTREYRTAESYSGLYVQSEALVRARSLRAVSSPRYQSRAVRAYSDVIRRFPGSGVERLAKEELKQLDPDAKIPEAAEKPKPVTSPPANDGFRTWTARAGNFSTRAKYLQQKAGKVQLMKEDGTKIVVDIAVLSDQDQAFLRRQ